MKTIINIIFITAVVVGVILVGCDSSAKKVADAREDVQKANDNMSTAQVDLYQAEQDSSYEFQKYKKESEERIRIYEQKIADLKLQIAREKKDGRSDYNKLVADLEQKNAELRKNLNEYKMDKQNKWEEFKYKFDRNLEDLGNSISNFFTDEKK